MKRIVIFLTVLMMAATLWATKVIDPGRYGPAVQGWDANLDSWAALDPSSFASSDAQLAALAASVPSANKVWIWTSETTGEMADVAEVSDTAYPTGWDGDYINSATRDVLFHEFEKLIPVGMSIVIDGGGSEIADAKEVWVESPYTFTITSSRLFADVSGDIQVDVWVDTYINYPPTVADTICAKTLPTIAASGTKYEDATLTDWTKTIHAGDIVKVHVVSCTTITKCTLSLRGTR